MSDARQFKVYKDMVGRMKVRDLAYVADNAVVIGDVRLMRDANIWFGVTIRGDDASIEIGEATNIQDNTCIHVDTDAPARIGHSVSVGHGAILHGIEIGDYSLIGMGAIVLGGSRIGAYSIIGAGALVPENAVIPPRSVVLGLPGKVKRQVSEAEMEEMRWRASHYVARARSYLE